VLCLLFGGSDENLSAGLLVEGAADGEGPLAEDVGVDHGGADIGVAEEFLDGADVVAVLEEVGGEGVAEGVAVDALLDFGLAGGVGDGFLEGVLVAVVAAGEAGAGVDGEAGGGEGVLPLPVAACVGEFAGERFGEVDLSVAGGEVLVVEDADLGEMGLEGGQEAFGEEGESVFAAFAFSDDDLFAVEVDVFDAQAAAFEEPESAAVEEFGHESVGSAHGGEDVLGLLGGEDDGESPGAAGGAEFAEVSEGPVEDMIIEEGEAVEGDVVGGGGDFEIDGEVCEEGADAVCPGVLWFGAVGEAFAEELEVAVGPGEVCLFGAEGVSPAAEGVPHLGEVVGLGPVSEEAVEESECLFGLSDGVVVGPGQAEVVAVGAQVCGVETGGGDGGVEVGAELCPAECVCDLCVIEHECLEEVVERFPGSVLACVGRNVVCHVRFALHVV
jgi:hypothetical protein